MSAFDKLEKNDVLTLMDSRLTKNFTLKEFFVTNAAGGYAGLVDDYVKLNKYQQELVYRNVELVAIALQEVVRDAVNASVVITSGWRSERVNRLVGGTRGSAHTLGMAVDFYVEGFTKSQMKALANRLNEEWGGGFAYNPKLNFIHIDTRLVPFRWSYS
jgi:uncharacterized protein YcbK (DUF882 family)